jgi:hypothetical protein
VQKVNCPNYPGYICVLNQEIIKRCQNPAAIRRERERMVEMADKEPKQVIRNCIEACARRFD